MPKIPSLVLSPFKSYTFFKKGKQLNDSLTKYVIQGTSNKYTPRTGYCSKAVKFTIFVFKFSLIQQSEYNLYCYIYLFIWRPDTAFSLSNLNSKSKTKVIRLLKNRSNSELWAVKIKNKIYTIYNTCSFDSIIQTFS